jgi:hypothetical protein
MSSPIGLSEVRDAQSLAYCMVLCRSLSFVLSLFTIAFIDLLFQITPFGIFNLFTIVLSSFFDLRFQITPLVSSTF